MADYRRECCGGFPGHSHGCPSIERGRQIDRLQKARKKKEEEAWTEFFDLMTDEDIFAYVTKAEIEIAKTDKWRLRQRKAMDYIRNEKIYQGQSRYLDRLREWQKEYYARRNNRTPSE